MLKKTEIGKHAHDDEHRNFLPDPEKICRLKVLTFKKLSFLLLMEIVSNRMVINEQGIQRCKSIIYFVSVDI